MNRWVQQSIALANAQGYLDRLHEVYPVSIALERPLSGETKNELWQAFQSKDEVGLLRILLNLDKFPIKDPYVAFLRKKQGQFIPKNPQTVQRVAKKILSMDFEQVIAGIEEPKEFNRQIGSLFKRWLSTLPYPALQRELFERSSGIALLEGTEAELMQYANTVLDCDLTKGPDLVAKCSQTVVVGEAKFLTDYGGHQYAQFKDALSLLNSDQGNATRIAILDGVVWIESNTKMFRTVSSLEQPALSALLLDELLQEVDGR